eukprot:TRINITY_DN9914_c0_g1_i2.p1 TRINITY_DN9914_c0_g1~~TRINITY_DN9914_c0_g1_i2.p1  ORF type:complete len:689 (+),score=180.59 TRINITY_DN9914_c0_g1_i2:612-2678(+)
MPGEDTHDAAQSSRHQAKGEPPAPSPRAVALQRLRGWCKEVDALVAHLPDIPTHIWVQVSLRHQRSPPLEETPPPSPASTADTPPARTARRGARYPFSANPGHVEFVLGNARPLIDFLTLSMTGLANGRGGSIVFGMRENVVQGIETHKVPVPFMDMLVHIAAVQMHPKLELELYQTAIIPVVDCDAVLYQVRVDDTREYGARPYRVAGSVPSSDGTDQNGSVLLLYPDLRGLQPLPDKTVKQLRELSEWKVKRRTGPRPYVKLPAEFIEPTPWETNLDDDVPSEDEGAEAGQQAQQQDRAGSPYSLRCPVGHSLGRHRTSPDQVVECSVSREGCREVSGEGRVFLYCKYCNWRVCDMCFEPLMKESVVVGAMREYRKTHRISRSTQFMMSVLARSRTLPPGSRLQENIDSLQSLVATPSLIHTLVLALLQLRPNEDEWAGLGTSGAKCADGIGFYMRALLNHFACQHEALVFGEMVSCLSLPHLSDDGARLLARVHKDEPGDAQRLADVITRATTAFARPARSGASATIWAHFMGYRKHRVTFEAYLRLSKETAVMLARPMYIALCVEKISDDWKACVLQDVLKKNGMAARYEARKLEMAGFREGESLLNALTALTKYEVNTESPDYLRDEMLYRRGLQEAQLGKRDTAQASTDQRADPVAPAQPASAPHPSDSLASRPGPARHDAV